MMKRCLQFFLSFLLFFGAVYVFLPISSVQAAGEFITTWKTDNPGVTDTDEIRIPVYDGQVYNYNVGWGDGTYSSGLTASTTHEYAVPGTYTVSVSGTFPGIGFILAGDREKILSVDQWGTNPWAVMGGAFFGCTNLQILASDAPDLSAITDLTYSFRSTNVSGGFEDWDVSHISTFLGTFQDTRFNGAIGNWDMSGATNIAAMFYGNPVFNQDIGDWDISNVTSLNGLFYGDGAFNQDIGSWDTSQVTNMAGLFYHATSFNQDLSEWNIEQVTTMSEMLEGGELSLENYDLLLTSWSAQTVQPSVTFHAGSSTYCATEARGELTGTPQNWIITDGGNLCLTEVRPLAQRTTITDAVYSFQVTDLVETLLTAETGAYSSTLPACHSCSVVIDPVRHTVSFGGLRIGDVLDFTLTFTRANRLRIGSSIVVAPPLPTGGGAVGSLPVQPMIFLKQGIPAPPSFELNSGVATTTSPLVSLALNADPRTVRGYVISLDPTFAKDGIFPFTHATSSFFYSLPERPGTYTVYLKYYSLAGEYSPLLSRVITLEAPRAPDSIARSTQDPSSTAKCLSLGVLKQGSVGQRVKMLQRILAAQGATIYPERLVTGFFGSATKRAVVRLQERYATDILAPLSLSRGTGIVREATDTVLCRLRNGRGF